MEPFLLQIGVIAAASAAGVGAFFFRSAKRREIEKATGGRFRLSLRGQVLEAQPKGLPLRILLHERGDQNNLNTATVTIPLSLSPQAEFFVGPKEFFSKPVEQFFTGLPPVETDIPWLKEWQVRGAPPKAVAAVLSRAAGLQDFRESGWKPRRLSCKASELEIHFETHWVFEASNLKALVELSAEFAFRLMG